MTSNELIALYEKLIKEHGQSASILLQAILLERLGKRIESAIAGTKNDA